MTTVRATAPWIFWPIAAAWDLVAFVVKLAGRLVGVVLALVLMGSGVLLSLTVVLLPIGIPLGILGFLLLLRSIF
jgi:hypothetical protein